MDEEALREYRRQHARDYYWFNRKQCLQKARDKYRDDIVARRANQNQYNRFNLGIKPLRAMELGLEDFNDLEVLDRIVKRQRRLSKKNKKRRA
jgi:hypothetical protein